MTKEEFVLQLLAILCSVSMLVLLAVTAQLIMNSIRNRVKKAKDKIEWLEFNGKLGRKQFVRLVLEATTFTKLCISTGKQNPFWVCVDPKSPHFELYYVASNLECNVTWVPKALLQDDKFAVSANARGMLLTVVHQQEKAGFAHRAENQSKIG